MGLSDALGSASSRDFSFDQINSGTRYSMTEQFGRSGVKAMLYSKKYAEGDNSIAQNKQFQQNLLAQTVGYSNYRRMGEALKKGKVSSQDVRNAYYDLEAQGRLNPDYFTIESKGPQVSKLSQGFASSNRREPARSTFTSRRDIRQKMLQNEISSYAQEHGFTDNNDNPSTLLFLQAVDSGQHRDRDAQELLDEYKSTFDTTSYMLSDYAAFKESRGLSIPDGRMTVDDLAARLGKRF